MDGRVAFRRSVEPRRSLEPGWEFVHLRVLRGPADEEKLPAYLSTYLIQPAITLEVHARCARCARSPRLPRSPPLLLDDLVVGNLHM